MLLGLTVPKLLLILFIGFVVFGPGKLPKVGKSLGESLRAFKAASSDTSDEKKETSLTVEKKSRM